MGEAYYMALKIIKAKMVVNGTMVIEILASAHPATCSFHLHFADVEAEVRGIK
jgi:hypothetical protein